ncbi:SGNH/GDSL hydrolase family protein [Labrys wisconsinensis]|uniref:SGNH hydrolase-type esterase domain-containing protein n=1 Tax=Labrys wisconsinensis TaxID=425677 RepID=A0ABU0JEY3_9HYPH|nr:SGNH/GDSL hydrolase family protein [Labrys wisconsinensis]MDQ0472834.1 hypothetical protein [Labrys wisconsinensis]
MASWAMPTQGSLQWIIAGNRFGAHRSVTTGSPGRKMMSGRLHKSPPVDLQRLAVVYPWYVVDTELGELTVGGAATVSAGLEAPLGSAPGPYRAFRFGSGYTGMLTDYQTLRSDPSGVRLPASSLYRLRSYCAAAGLSVFGRPGLGGAGGSMSAYGGAVDCSALSSSGTDLTQVGTAIAAYTNDLAFEPVLIGETTAAIDSWMIVGDSISDGAGELGIPSGTPAGAGDPYGNAGYAERAFGIRDVPYVNLSKPGATAKVWTAGGERRIGYFQQFCNRALLALGRNDLGVDGADAIIAFIETMYRKLVRDMDTWVCTIVPSVITTDGGASLAGQTPQPYDGDRRAVNAWIRSGAVIPANRVFDLEAAVRDTSTGQILWRVDGGPWCSDGLHPTQIAHTAAGIALAALI